MEASAFAFNPFRAAIFLNFPSAMDSVFVFSKACIQQAAHSYSLLHFKLA